MKIFQSFGHLQYLSDQELEEISIWSQIVKKVQQYFLFRSTFKNVQALEQKSILGDMSESVNRNHVLEDVLQQNVFGPHTKLLCLHYVSLGA